jgi:hypothetical protein
MKNKCNVIVLVCVLFFGYTSFAFIKEVVGIIPRPDVKFNGEFDTSINSAFLATSGAIYDTRPVLTHCLSLRGELSDNFFIDAYGWLISSLHTLQKESHRVLFSEFEGTIRFGHDYYISKNTLLESKAGLLWNPQIGYYDAHNNYWGPYIAQYLKNDYIIPYWDGLWMLAPRRSGRVRIGIRKPYKITDKLSLTPFIETIWMDRRRFAARYSDEPTRHAFLGGAFGTLTFGISGRYKINEHFSWIFSFSQFDIINSQARRAVKSSTKYYAKCDWPVFKLGLSYNF